jgi:hypothetical protein
MPSAKKKKRPLLVPGEENILTGRQLTDMGKYIDSDGFLISNTLKYSVWCNPGNWQIRKLKNR